MKILLNKDNVIVDFGKDIVLAKTGGVDGGLQECVETEATHIWNREKNSAVMANKNISGITMVEVENIPEEVKIYEYKYVNEGFVINEDYTPYVDEKDRISALEDMVNMLLLGGIE